MEYIVDDYELDAKVFLSLANSVWPGEYDVEKTQNALKKTINITAYEENRLIGCIRILSDGYYFGTITELLVLPEFQKKAPSTSIHEIELTNPNLLGG